MKLVDMLANKKVSKFSAGTRDTGITIAGSDEFKGNFQKRMLTHLGSLNELRRHKAVNREFLMGYFMFLPTVILQTIHFMRHWH